MKSYRIIDITHDEIPGTVIEGASAKTAVNKYTGGHPEAKKLVVIPESSVTSWDVPAAE